MLLEVVIEKCCGNPVFSGIVAVASVVVIVVVVVAAAVAAVALAVNN